MKILKLMILAFGLGSFGSFAQEVPVDELPIATIDENYYVTLPVTEMVAEYYYVDISGFGFSTAEEAEKVMNTYVHANLVSNEVNFEDQYMIVHIHTEFLGEDLSLAPVQEYLGHLTKPTE